MEIKFKLGVITDEVTQDIFEAAEFCHKHGLKCMEVRSVNGHSPFDYTDEDVDQIIAAAKKYDLEVSAISSPVFKCEYDDQEAIKANIAGTNKQYENIIPTPINTINGSNTQKLTSFSV